MKEIEFSQVKWRNFNGRFFIFDNDLCFRDENNSCIDVITGLHYGIDDDQLIIPVYIDTTHYTPSKEIL